MDSREKLEQRIELHKQQRRDSELEWNRRGSELEKINTLVSAWKDILPDKFHARVRKILDGYIERCTISKGTENLKYQKRPQRIKLS